MKKFFIILFFCFISPVPVQADQINCVANQPLPDSSCTPGAVLTTSTRTICVEGYTKTVRQVPESVKKEVFKRYGILYENRAEYQVDHLIPLGLGGSNDISNLWPEKYDLDYGVAAKVELEDYLYRLMCSGEISPEEAQFRISVNWLEQYKLMLSTHNSGLNSRPSSTQSVTIINKNKLLNKINVPRCGDCIGDIIGCELDVLGCLWSGQSRNGLYDNFWNKLVDRSKIFLYFVLPTKIRLCQSMTNLIL